MSITSTDWPIPPAGEEPALETEPPPDSELPVRPGDVLSGRYAVDRVLASGGMGVVCLGRHLDLEQPVAIKFLRRELSQNQAVVQRFLNEARAAASLRSEHVVRVMDVAELESGRPYLVMEHLDGVDLGALVEREGALEPSRALGYVLDVCAALTEAHAAGIVHRDIKPENLILCTVSGRDVVKVVDFGLAKRIDSARTNVVTDPREGMGSPCYMSPEQIATPHAVDARTDIWSLGVVLYRLVTGVLPFDGDSVSEVCARVLNATPRRLEEFGPDLASLDPVVSGCLQKNRENRIASIDELAREIRAYRSAALTDTQPFVTSAPPPTAGSRMPSDAPAALPSRPDTSRRYVLPFVASLVAFVAVGATLGGYVGGDVAHMREIAEWAMSDKPAEDDVAGDLLRHPSRYLDVSTVAPGVYAAHAVAVSGGAVTVRAEPEMSERDRRKDADTEKVEGTDGQKLESYEPQRASRADREKTEHRDASGEPSGAAASADRDGKDLSAEEIARRERRYRRYLDRHGYKPIREVLEQIERPAPSDAPGPAPAAPSDPGRSDSRSP